MVSSQHSELDRICDKVEQLLTRHEQLRQTNVLLQDQLAALLEERARTQKRVDAACGRIDTLLQRLPTSELVPVASPAPSSMPR